MNPFKSFLALVLVLLPQLLFAQSQNEGVWHHNLNVTLVPDQHRLEVEDQIQRLDSSAQTLVMKLHKGLAPEVVGNKALLVKTGEEQSDVEVEVYEFTWPHNVKSLTIRYQGVIDHSFAKELSPGTIDPQGVVLMGSTYWYPTFANQRVTFRLQMQMNKPWTLLSQGEVVNSKLGQATWVEKNPQDDIYIVAGDFYEYRLAGDRAEAFVYLRKDEPLLAKNYLEKTHEYLELYSNMLGDYPYRRFSMIENFWETGFGMPSFTLLGPTVLRLPFILYTSYPHEILHNWWGNGVFVDYEKGNWCEGLTAYLADHYFKEKSGQGAEYRRTALQNFSDYVHEGNDIPLSQFTGRHNSATRAIGYDKSLMFYHMLRTRLGDKDFFKGLRHFYQTQKFRRASFADLQNSLEWATGESLRVEFQQWVYRTGAPKLYLEKATRTLADEGHYVTRFELHQKQETPFFYLYIPIRLTFADHTSGMGYVHMLQKESEFTFHTTQKPIQLEIDPDFDVFRYPHQQEVPATLSGVMGETNTTYVVLPQKQRDRYQKVLNQIFQETGQKMEWVGEENLEFLSPQKTYLIVGWDNRFLSEVQSRVSSLGVRVSESHITVNDQVFDPDHHSAWLTFRENERDKKQWSWFVLTEKALGDELAEKVLHYGSYSAIVFDERNSNQLKLKWPTLNSPLKVKF